MRYLLPHFVVLTVATGLSASAWAHHSRGNFNQELVLEFQGVVKEFTWRNPHAFTTLDVEMDSGETKELLLELNSIAVLTREGWTRDTLSVGDEVTVFANPDFDSSKNLYYSNYLILPDGELIASAPGSAPDVVPRRPQRQIDQTTRSEDLSGIWRTEGGRFGVGGMGMGAGNATPAAVSLGGQTAAVGLPVTALGQAELDSWDARDNPWFRCVSKTPPWLFSGVGAHWFVRDSDDEVLIRHEILDVERTVHLGMTGHPPETEPSHLGHSIGWFEGETLVVDTAYFAPAQWGIGNGVSSSEQKHLIERFTLMGDGRRMRLEYTIEDPVYLTEPVSLSQTFGLDSGYPWQDEYGCDAEASSRHIIE